MITEYNYLRLLRIDEFDAREQSEQQGCKEVFFVKLSNFTTVSEIIIRKYDLGELARGNVDTKQLAVDINKLQTLLGSIGAVALERNIQTLEKYYKDKDYASYADGLSKIFSSVSTLRRRIIEAEKQSDSLPIDQNEQDGEKERDSEKAIIDTPKEKAAVQRDKFERLFTLVDNFEYDSAMSLLKSIMSFSYTPEIDSLVNAVFAAMHVFNYDNALKEATRLINLIISLDKGQRRILFIDDVPEVIRIVKALLKDKYIVFGMTNYNSAIKFLTNNTVDLILLDIEMPDVDGFEMLQLIRKFPNYEKTPIIFLTGNATLDNVKTAIHMGANDFITKPVDEKALIEKLEKAFEIVINSDNKI